MWLRRHPIVVLLFVAIINGSQLLRLALDFRQSNADMGKLIDTNFAVGVKGVFRVRDRRCFSDTAM